MKHKIWRIGLVLVVIFALSSCTLMVSFDQKNSLCGNGNLEPEEVCENDDLRNQDPTCNPDEIAHCKNCRWECLPNLCGNGELDEGEQCDEGVNIEPMDVQTCTNGASPICHECRYACPEIFCGDGKIQNFETCDPGAALPIDITCIAGFYPACSPDCQNIDCMPNCGNGILDEGESCDGSMMRPDLTCRSAGHFGGFPACSLTCEADFGACLSAVLLGDTGFDRVADIAVDADGSVYVLGDTTSPEFWGQPAAPMSAGADVVVVKWDAYGMLQWVHRFSDFRMDDAAVALAADASFVYGVASVRKVGSNDAIDTDVYIFKLDSADGHLEKDTTIQSRNGILNAVDVPTSLRLGSGETLYVTGYLAGSLPGIPSLGAEDGFVVKLRRADLGIVWTRLLGGIGNDRVFDAVEQASESGTVRVLLTGDSANSISIATLNSQGTVLNDSSFRTILIPFDSTASEITGISLESHPTIWDVYGVVNYTDEEGNNRYYLFRAGPNTFLRSVDINYNMTARRVRFSPHGLLVFGNAYAPINNVNPQGNSMVFLSILDENLNFKGTWVFDSNLADEAGGLAWEGNTAICMGATAGGPFQSFASSTDVHVVGGFNRGNMAVWCIPYPELQGRIK